MVSVTTMTPTQPLIEDFLCFKVRLKVLTALAEYEKLTTSEIADKLGTNFGEIRKHLEALESIGIVTHANFGKRIRYYRFGQTRKANAIRNLIDSWHNQENHVE